MILKRTGRLAGSAKLARRRKTGYCDKMAYVRFTSALNRFFPKLEDEKFEASSVAELIRVVDQKHPGLADYLLDERGALRKHVNVFIGDRLVTDRIELMDEIDSDSRVCIFQALSGG